MRHLQRPASIGEGFIGISGAPPRRPVLPAGTSCSPLSILQSCGFVAAGLETLRLVSNLKFHHLLWRKPPFPLGTRSTDRAQRNFFAKQVAGDSVRCGIEGWFSVHEKLVLVMSVV